MDMGFGGRRKVVALAVVATLLTAAGGAPAGAGWVATSQVSQPGADLHWGDADRRQAAALFAELGLDRWEAQRRLQGLTDGEIRWLLEVADDLPAAGSGDYYQEPDDAWVYGCLLVATVLASASLSILLLLAL